MNWESLNYDMDRQIGALKTALANSFSQLTSVWFGNSAGLAAASKNLEVDGERLVKLDKQFRQEVLNGARQPQWWFDYAKIVADDIAAQGKIANSADLGLAAQWKGWVAPTLEMAVKKIDDIVPGKTEWYVIGIGVLLALVALAIVKVA